MSAGEYSNIDRNWDQDERSSPREVVEERIDLAQGRGFVEAWPASKKLGKVLLMAAAGEERVATVELDL